MLFLNNSPAVSLVHGVNAIELGVLINILLAVRTGMAIDLLNNGVLMIYSFICMIISHSDLV